MTFPDTTSVCRVGSALLLAALLTGCASIERETDRVEVEIRGTDPAATLPTATLPAASASAPSGDSEIVDYGDYRVAVARDGDTVASVAARIGISPTALGAYNGIQPSTVLLAGDELVLPEDAGTELAAAEPLPAAPPQAPPEVEPLPEIPVHDMASPAAVEEEAVVVVDPLPTPDTAPSEAPAPTEAEEWSPALAAAAIDRSTESDEAGSADLPPPPSAAEPVPAAPAEPRAIASPALGRYQTPKPLATPFELTRPVDGPVAVPFNIGATGQRNEGVDFAVAAGTPVVAAEDGEVALVSESLGGLGTIVLLRHPEDLMTVYGRIDEVRVQKGDYLERGQRLGVVAEAPPGTEPRMHFEVRRGAESLDPMDML